MNYKGVTVGAETRSGTELDMKGLSTAGYYFEKFLNHFMGRRTAREIRRVKVVLTGSSEWRRYRVVFQNGIMREYDFNGHLLRRVG